MSRLAATPVTPAPTGLPCSVAVALRELDTESAADLQAWLEGKRRDLGTDADMWVRLQGLNMRVGKQTIGRHRRFVRGVGGDVCRCAA